MSLKKYTVLFFFCLISKIRIIFHNSTDTLEQNLRGREAIVENYGILFSYGKRWVGSHFPVWQSVFFQANKLLCVAFCPMTSTITKNDLYFILNPFTLGSSVTHSMANIYLSQSHILYQANTYNIFYYVICVETTKYFIIKQEFGTFSIHLFFCLSTCSTLKIKWVWKDLSIW